MDEEKRPENQNVRLSSLEKKVVQALTYYLGGDASSVCRNGILDLGRKCGITIVNVDEILGEIDAAHKKKAPKH
jgi:hypothetical protein